MNKHVNYTWVGAFVVVFIVLLIWIAVWMSSMMGKKTYLHYQVYARTDVSGLGLASAVRFSGVKVGTVTEIEIDPSDSQAVIITIQVVEGTPVTASSVATIETEGITGVQYVGLKSLSAKGKALQIKKGAKYPVIRFEPSFFMRLSSAVKLVTGEVEALGSSMREMLSVKNRRAFSDSLQNIQEVTANLAHNSKHLSKVIASTDTILKNTAIASHQFPAVVNQARVVMKDLSETATVVRSTAYKASDMLQTSDEFLRAAMQQVLPEIQSFTGSLNQIGDNVSVLTGEIKRNPAVIIRGRKPSALGPGER